VITRTTSLTKTRQPGPGKATPARRSA
jgi:hypothetical protein